MENKIISEGKTTTEAIEKGLKKLNVSRQDVDIKVLEEKKKSFFNILDPHVVKVEISVKDKYHEEKNHAKVEEVSSQDFEKTKVALEKFLNEFLGAISENIQYTISEQDDQYLLVEINGKDATKLIGYRGEALNALQLILTNVAANAINSSVKIIVDIENYRNKRKNTLEELAVKIEKTVTKSGKKVTLEPMSPYERKIIHTKLQDSPTVRTYSIGEDLNRRVVICKK